MRFPYTTIPNSSPRPYLNVIVRVGTRTSDIIKAIVDSGADYSIFPMEVANFYLGLDLSRADIWTFSGTTGVTQTARLATVSITILAPNGLDHAYEIETLCAFCDTFKFSGGVLLGQSGFFSQFRTCFYQPQQYFEIDTWNS